MSTGSATPPAFAPRPDDDDDVRWALSTALVQWNRGGRADAVVWLRRAGEAADASGAPARAEELRAYAAKLAESLWSNPPSVARSSVADDVEIEIHVDDQPRRPPPPANVVAAAQHASRDSFSPRHTERQSFADLEPPRGHFASAPEIELDEEALDPTELEEILDYVGEDDVEYVEDAARSVEPAAVDLSAVSDAQFAASYYDDDRNTFPEERAPSFVEEAGLPEPEFPRQSRPSEARSPAVAFADDDDFEDRVTLVPASEDGRTTDLSEGRDSFGRLPLDTVNDEALSWAPPSVPESLSVTSEPPESVELLEGESAAAIDADLGDAYRPESIDLGADWSPIESERVLRDSLAPVESKSDQLEELDEAPLSSAELIAIESIPPSVSHEEAVAGDSLPPLEFPSEPPAAASEDALELEAVSLAPSSEALSSEEAAPDSIPAVLVSVRGAPSPASAPSSEMVIESVEIEAVEPSSSPVESEGEAESSAYAEGTVIDGVDLMMTRGFEDLPEEVQEHLASVARVETLSEGEEISVSGAAVITHGQVSVLPAVADEAGAYAMQADVVFTRGTLDEAVSLRVVAKAEGTRVAVWSKDELAAAMADCPWVHDELRLIADRLLAVCGATLGPLGERLDESLRTAVFQRLEARVFAPGETLTEEGKPLPGLFVIGGGRVDFVKDGAVVEQKYPGDFLFAAEIMGGAPCPYTAVAGEHGALALYASRSVAHELMISVPPLLEVLAG